jgi:hypothetical protein
MITRCKNVTGRKSHPFRHAIIDSSAAPVRQYDWPPEAATRGSGASPAPLFSAAEIAAGLPSLVSRLRDKPMTENSALVSVGPHESRGIRDALFLGIADRVLNQQENKEDNREVLAGSLAEASEETPFPESDTKTRRDARQLLHYRQD